MGMNTLIVNVLKEVGINPERFALQWASAAEAPRFVKLITDFTNRMAELGPLGSSEGIAPEELKGRIAKALEVVSDQKVRVSFGNATKAVRKDGIWTKEHIDSVVSEKMAKALESAFGTAGS